MAIVASEAGMMEVGSLLDDCRPADLVVSDFARAEFVAAMARRVRTGELADALLPGTASKLDELTSGWTVTHLDTHDLRTATEIVLNARLGLRLPDAIHLAIARRMSAALVTLDRQQHRAALALGDSVAGPLAGVH